MEIKRIDSIGNYVEINPIKVNFKDTVMANAFTVFMHDDTVACVIDYKLYNLTVITQMSTPIDKTEPIEITSMNVQQMFVDGITIKEDDYIDWKNNQFSTEYVFNFVANKIGLVLVD